jgi:CDGSH-type Zn-finger protein
MQCKSVLGTRQTFGMVVPRRAQRVAVKSCEGKNHPINPSIRKDEAKVVDTADVSAQEKPQVAYCRCWRSGTFPLCDGEYVVSIDSSGRCDDVLDFAYRFSYEA